MARVDADRNLLFGLLALQNNFIDRDALLDAFSRWVHDRAVPLGQVLRDRGALDPDDHEALEGLLARYLKKFRDDPEKSLQHLSSIGSVRDDLARIADADLQASLAHVAAARPDDDPYRTIGQASLGASTSIGSRFRVLRPHARGGLGQVSVALDKELDRPVALKEIQERHADEPLSRARFVQEAEITGKLEHPGIIPVYGLGHDLTGRPFYAMRFIQGDSLKEAIAAFHGDEGLKKDPVARMSRMRELLRRFTDVCNAIAYAHSRGVLHRDLKPGNIMLGPYGETLVVDWGLAKPVGAELSGDGSSPMEGPIRLSEQSGSRSETVAGSPVGTPAYASPEQVSGAWHRLGPASDVYGLGATLYALLTGRAPVDGNDLGEVIRRVQHGEIPPPRSIDPTIPAPLEAICHKAMATDPGDRYDSARALAMDVTKWLDDEPVTAYQEPFSVRVGRWMRRHRTTVMGAAAAVLVGLVGLAAVAAVLSWSNRELKVANEKTTEALKQAEAVLSFLNDGILAAARPEGQEGGLGVDVTVRKAVDAAEPKIAERFKDQPLVEAEVRDVLGITYLHLRETALAIPQHERAAQLRESRLSPDHPLTLASRNNLAEAYLSAGRTDQAIAMLQATLTLRESKLGLDHPDTLRSRNSLANAYQSAGRTAEAISMLEATLALRESKLGPDHPATLESRNSLANAYWSAGRTGEAIAMHEAKFKLCESKLGRDHPATLESRNNLATAYQSAGRTAEAIAMHEATLKLCESRLGPDHPDTLQSRNNLASAYWSAGHTDKAITMDEATLKLRESRLGPDHPDTLQSRNNLASDYWSAGRTAEAITTNEATLKLKESKLGPHHPDTLTSRNNLAIAYSAAGRTGEAIAMHEATLKLRESKLGPDHPHTLVSRHNLAEAYLSAGRTAEAIAMHEATLKLQESKLGPDHPDTLKTRNNLSVAYWKMGRLDRSIPLFEATLKQRETKLGRDHLDTVMALANLGVNYRDAGRLDDGVRLIEEALDRSRKRHGSILPSLGFAVAQLAISYDRARQFDKSEPIYRGDLERARKQFGPSDPRTAGAMAQLGLNLSQQRKWFEAESVLRECLAIREKALSDDWSRFNAMSLLGGTLLGQGRYAEAEPLIVPGYEGMKSRAARIPAPGKPRLADAAERVVRLYEGWGKPGQAEVRKRKLGLADLPADVFASP